MEDIEYTNIYYFYSINSIGGIETFFYQLAKKYKDYDLTIFYKQADIKQLERLSKYVRCVPYVGQKIKCKRAFFNFNIDIINNVEAEEYILVIHGDYKDMMQRGQIDRAPSHSKITKYVGVSERACKSFTEVTGKPCELCYNPFEREEPQPVLHLISATRLTREKGKDRMIRLAKMLDAAGIKYIWTIFTNDINAIDNPNIIYMKPRLDVLDFVAKADYLIQVSDNEGYCYSVVEALCEGVPVIVTPCPVFEELGLVDGKNCYIVPFDMEGFDVKKLLKKPTNFNYKPKKDRWDELLLKGESTWAQQSKQVFTVEALSTYEDKKITDNELKCIPPRGKRWDVNYNRMLILTGQNEHHLKLAKVIGVKTIEDTKKSI